MFSIIVKSIDAAGAKTISATATDAADATATATTGRIQEIVHISRLVQFQCVTHRIDAYRIVINVIIIVIIMVVVIIIDIVIIVVFIIVIVTVIIVVDVAILFLWRCANDRCGNVLFEWTACKPLTNVFGKIFIGVAFEFVVNILREKYTF